ncbi:MAG: hypothetical protein JSV77_06550 [Dehalococcoidales bacterium]|nr:MAG: hypothetical protein JSV77_06550 [Dehalococcoidales bacterium]
MPIERDIPLSLTPDNILRRQGIRQRTSRPEIAAITEKLLSEMFELCLLEPVAAYNIYSIATLGDDRVSLDNGMEIRSISLPSLLSESRELAVVVCTIGHRLEKQVTDYLKGNEPLRGLLLDGIGSAAVDSLSQEACKLIQNEASLRGYQASSRFSPGTSGFPITEQWQLFELVPADEIGVSLAASGLMVPRKSVSMVIGLGQQVTVQKRGEACARCNLSKTCLYRWEVNNQHIQA